MGLNQTPSAERLHIGFFGKRNAGKSSVMNAVTGQDLAVVSEVKGTTTDPVYKSMELLPLGPVVMMDTPGIDDEGELGSLRVRKSYQTLNKTDGAVLVLDGQVCPGSEDLALLKRIQDKKIPYVVAVNKADALSEAEREKEGEEGKKPASGWRWRKVLEDAGVREDQILMVSARLKEGIDALKERLAEALKEEGPERAIVRDLLKPGDLAVLVVPIDKAAPKGRLILPQQQTIRDLLDGDCQALVVKENGLKDIFESIGKKPKLVITDSQVFGRVSKDTPKDILLTSFSILFARYKGNLESVVRGVTALDRLKDGDQVLISEGCSHHRQCGDIGTVKLPAWIREYTKKELTFEFTSGTEFPDDLTPYQLIVHCGGCMLNEREMKYRLSCAEDQQVPMTNYGILIAYVHGILKRSVEVFPEIYRLLQE